MLYLVVLWFLSTLIIERLRKVSRKIAILAFAFEDCSRRVRCLLYKNLVIFELVTFFRGEGRGNI